MRSDSDGVSAGDDVNDARDSGHNEDQNSSYQNSPSTPPDKGTGSDAFTSPPSRSLQSSQISINARKGLQQLVMDLHSTESVTCVVTHGIETFTLQVCHLVPKSTKDETLKLYEYCLGLEYKSFHVHSRWNLLYMAIQWHVRFDRNLWFLLPSLGDLKAAKSFLEKVQEARARPRVEHVGDASRPDPITEELKADRERLLRPQALHDFTFVPFDKLTSESLTEHRGPSAVNNHFYPFHTLSDRRSHVSPMYVIFNAGPKLEEKLEKTHGPRNTFDFAEKVSHFVETWCAAGTNNPPAQRKTELEERFQLLVIIWEMVKSSAEDARKWMAPKGRDAAVQESRVASSVTGYSTRPDAKRARDLEADNDAGPASGNQSSENKRLRQHVSRSDQPSLTRAALRRLQKRKWTGSEDTERDSVRIIKEWIKGVSEGVG